MAIISMTGFGEAVLSLEAEEIRVEAKSVNNRFLDCSVKLPGQFAVREGDVHSLVKKYCRRGRVEISVARNQQRSGELRFSLNSEQLKSFLDVVKQGCEIATVDFDKIKSEVFVQAISRREVVELVQQEKVDSEGQQQLLEAVEKALINLAAMREVEGGKTEAALRGHLAKLEKLKKEIEKKAKSMASQFHARLEERLAKLAPELQLDPQRLAQEVAILVDKADISEELVRLESHFSQFDLAIAQGDGGRKLEFLLQECNREINTIGSKSQDTDISARVVEAKTELEKIREQVQNIE